MDNKESHQKAVLDFLSSSTEPIQTLKVARAVLGPKSTCKDINPLLYSMLKDGLLKKIADEGGRNPRWTKS